MDYAQTGFYDPHTETLWIPRRFFTSGSRVPKDEILHWVRAFKRGATTEDGRPIRSVKYLFMDEATAAHNHQALSYARIGVYYQEGGNRLPYVPPNGEIQYDVRSDVGIIRQVDGDE